MNQQIDVKKLERKTYLQYHGDGLWDIFLSMFFLAFAASMLTDVAYMMGVWPAIFIPSIIKIKKDFAEKRMGYVKFSPEREAKEKSGKIKMTMIFTLTVIMGLVAFWAFMGEADWQLTIRELKFIPFGFVLFISLAAAGAFFEIWRFIWYGVLVLATVVAGHYMNTDLPFIFIFNGVIFLIIGLVMLIRFVRKYPRIDREAADVAE
ncbi:MAG: hypothetical protein AB1746_00445 [Candidatus Zixiibacteriota bacterium]